MTFLYHIFMFGQIVSHNLGGRANGHHNLFGVWLKPKASLPHYAAVRFQEHVEGAFNRMTFLLCYALFAGVGFYFLRHPLVFGAAVIPAFLIRLFPAYLRQMEMRGQSVETYIRAHYYGEHYDDAELANGHQLATVESYQRAFKGKTPVQVAAELRRWRGWAKRMCLSFARDIRGWL
jgi:hypothetical protein